MVNIEHKLGVSTVEDKFRFQVHKRNATSLLQSTFSPDRLHQACQAPCLTSTFDNPIMNFQRCPKTVGWVEAYITDYGFISRKLHVGSILEWNQILFIHFK